MADVDELYPLWLREARNRAKADLRRADEILGGLKNVGSTYWLAVQAMRDAKARVLDLYVNMPDTLPHGNDAASSRVGGGEEDGDGGKACVRCGGRADTAWCCETEGCPEKGVGAMVDAVTMPRDLGRALGVAPCGNTAYDEGPFTIAEDSEAVVLAIRAHLDGWASATFGWQDDPDPMVAERNKGAAIQAHAAECLRRIRVTLGVQASDGGQP